MRNSRVGFTLIEVLIVVVIIGIATAMAGAGFSLLMKKFTAKSVAYRLRDAVQLARSDAMSRSRNSGFALGAADLKWIRFIDNQSGGTIGAWDASDTLITRDSLPGYAVNSLSCTRMSASVCSIVFSPDGSTLNGGSMRLVARHGQSNISLSVLLIAATGFSIVEVH
jgi:prepilin-type N-terminal cleavage/methylation domain-containing protein